MRFLESSITHQAIKKPCVRSFKLVRFLESFIISYAIKKIAFGNNSGPLAGRVPTAIFSGWKIILYLLNSHTIN